MIEIATLFEMEMEVHERSVEYFHDFTPKISWTVTPDSSTRSAKLILWLIDQASPMRCAKVRLAK
jgi:hypothetical protein